MNKAILLDRDETLNFDPGYLNDPERVRLKPKVLEALLLLQKSGFLLLVVSNQSGVGRGLISEQELAAVNQRISELLAAGGVRIQEFFICPHTDEDGCQCRKPLPGLVEAAVKKYQLSRQHSYIVGDRLRDLQAGEFLELDGILVSAGEGQTEPGQPPANLRFRAQDLKEAADFILQSEYEKSFSYKIFSSRLDPALDDQLQLWGFQQRRIVFTNGCFDILHPGHLQYLWQARALGDVLVVGLNSDESVRGLKGDSRPVNKIPDRQLSLANLWYVDAVVPFSESTPLELIGKIRPQIHVKGGDYEAEKLPEFELIKSYGGEVVILPFRKGYSTTGILQRILQA